MHRRKKMTLAYITNNLERKASFMKRNMGMIKMVNELSTLCGMEACSYHLSPIQPGTRCVAIAARAKAMLARARFLAGRARAEAVLACLKKLSEMDRTMEMVNQESCTCQRIKKMNDPLQHIQKKNKHKELEIFMYKCVAEYSNLENLDILNAMKMNLVINQTLDDINSKMEARHIPGQCHPIFLPPIVVDVTEIEVAPPPPKRRLKRT
ncbi:hypothetical protein BUALT_Bualt12G0084600 [Buddleja alternifolia]|uniref:MADS-box domain-containing protein n=1 Tax=Buddleja alternifolia TaxID=168488 RepID=A0AAV6X029_9LAMI|nr:hypothetical protein BUALT_Bualt12G0084600 [Buddleja alternifolia]